MAMSNYDIQLEKKRKEREEVAKKLEMIENEDAIAEMNNKIKFLKGTSTSQASTIPEGNTLLGSTINENVDKIVSFDELVASYSKVDTHK